MNARYAVEGVIGRGGMSVVYRARQVDTGGRIVAYKRVAAAARVARLRHEAAALATLDHPNIIRIFDVVDDGGGVAIVMQHAAGGSLADRLAAGRLATPAQAVEVVAAIADALDSAHRRGILHADIKPSNILFTADGHPLLSDFGAALTDADADRYPVVVTPEYLDPTVGSGAPFDASSDVFALAVVALEMLTGHRRADIAQAAGVAPALAQVLARALSAQARDRFRDAAAFASALRAALPAIRTVAPGTDARTLDAPRSIAPGARHEPQTREFGPRPSKVRAGADATPVIPWRTVGAVAAALVLLPSLIGAGFAAETRPATVAVQSAARQPAPPPPAASAPCSGIPPAPRTGDVVRGDLGGNGCAAWAQYRNGVLTAAVPGRSRLVRVRLGGAQDQVVVGDWDCNGIDTAALYQDATGKVFEFDSWPRPGERLVSTAGTATGIVHGTAAVASTGACDTVRITPPQDT